MATLFLDPVNGADGSAGTSFATRKKTLGGFTLVAGDTVRVISSPAPTSLAQNATFTDSTSGTSQRTVTLTTAVTANIDRAEANWTAASNVTASNGAGSGTHVAKEGTNRQQLDVASGFTTGKIAYKALASTTDFSSYQQVSFWIQTSIAIASGTLKVVLCSDTTGDTIVNTATINRDLNVGRWTPITVDNAGALGSSIASVAIHAISDPGTVSIYLDNILACKASSSDDSLTLVSLIGKNTSNSTTLSSTASAGATSIAVTSASGFSVGRRIQLSSGGSSAEYALITAISGTTFTLANALANGHTSGDAVALWEPWWGVKSINDTSVILDGQPNAGISTGRGFSGTGESVTLWKRECLATPKVGTASTGVELPGTSGTSGNVITISGGWNRTDMSSVTGETITDGLDGFGYCWDTNTKDFLTFERLGGVRYDRAFNINSSSNDITFNSIVQASNCTDSSTTGAITIAGPSAGSNLTITDAYALANANQGIGTSSTSTTDVTITAYTGLSNGTEGIYMNLGNAQRWSLGWITCNNNGSGTAGLRANAVYLAVTGFLTCKANANAGLSLTSCHRPCVIHNLTTQSNGTFGVIIDTGVNGHRFYTVTSSSNTSGFMNVLNTSSTGEIILVNATFTDSTKFGTGFTSTAAGKDFRIFSHKEGGDATVNKIYSTEGQGTPPIVVQSVADSDRHTGSGLAWKATPSTSRNVYYPIRFSVAKIAVAATKTLTVKAWIKRSATTQTAKLFIPGGRIAGVDSDVSISASGGAATYQEETLPTVTPTENGIVEVFLDVYGGSSTDFSVIDDLTITST